MLDIFLHPYKLFVYASWRNAKSAFSLVFSNLIMTSSVFLQCMCVCLCKTLLDIVPRVTDTLFLFSTGTFLASF